ncbi:MAG TPA: cytochrome c [Vicinamibacteria bacterium]|nr:cytochrome c [Vicinamibacteria bacterium]
MTLWLPSPGRSKVLAALTFSTGFGLFLAPASAQEDENKPVIEYRQRLMVGQRASMASMADILKFKMPYDSSHFVAHAKNIGELSALIPDAFETKITEGLTDAKPEVWTGWDDFVAKSKALHAASAKLLTAAESGDMKAILPEVTAVSNACRACHDTYRKPEEERFKR